MNPNDLEGVANKVCNSKLSNIRSALKSLEARLFSELSDYYSQIRGFESVQTEKLRMIAELQCALDMVQSAKSKDEQIMIYNILKHVKS